MAMEFCEDRHELIVYENYNYSTRRNNPCPVCEVLDRESALESKVEELEVSLAKAIADRDEAQEDRGKLQRIIDAEPEDHR